MTKLNFGQEFQPKNTPSLMTTAVAVEDNNGNSNSDANDNIKQCLHDEEIEQRLNLYLVCLDFSKNSIYLIKIYPTDIMCANQQHP